MKAEIDGFSSEQREKGSLLGRTDLMVVNRSKAEGRFSPPSQKRIEGPPKSNLRRHTRKYLPVLISEVLH